MNDFLELGPDISGGGFSGFFPSYFTTGSTSIGLKQTRDPFFQCITDPLACNLSVDVWDSISAGIPISIGPDIIPTTAPSPEPGPSLPVITSGQEQPIMDYNDLVGIGGGTVDFPSLRPPTSLLDVFSAGLGLAQSFVSSPQVPAVTPGGTLAVNASVCPPKATASGMRAQHLSRPRKGSPRHCVSNRHMNSLNPHALRRATRRLSGFMTHVHSAQKAIRKALGHTVAPVHRARAARRGGCISCGRPARSCVC